MHFLKRNAHTSNVFKNLNTLKLLDRVTLENCILLCKYFNQSLRKTLYWFTLATASHINLIPDGLTQVALKYLLLNNMKLYERHSINVSVIYTCNYVQKLHVSISIYQMPKLKNLIKKYYTSKYN